MKKLLSSLALVALVGFGCASSAPAPTASSDAHYVNQEFGFTLDHSEAIEIRDREAENRADDYLGLTVDFFASVRNVTREEKPVSLAFFYAVPGLSVEEFTSALEASDPNGAVKVIAEEDVDVTNGGVAMKKITSTTQMGTDKIHYLWDHDGTTIIASVIIGEGTEFDPILATLKTL